VQIVSLMRSQTDLLAFPLRPYLHKRGKYAEKSTNRGGEGGAMRTELSLAQRNEGRSREKYLTNGGEAGAREDDKILTQVS